MKAISIMQPWAWAIAHGHKDIENRTWQTGHRGWVAIHASGRYYEDDFDELEELLGFEAEDDLDLGGIVGVVRIVDCVRHSRSKWFEGPFGFVLQDARPVKFLPCPGKLGLWTTPLL